MSANLPHDSLPVPGFARSPRKRPLSGLVLMGTAFGLPAVGLIASGVMMDALPVLLPFVWLGLSVPLMLLMGVVQQILTARWADPISRRCLPFPALKTHGLVGAALLVPVLALLWTELSIIGLDPRPSLLCLLLLFPLGWNLWRNPLRHDPEFGWQGRNGQQAAATQNQEAESP